MAFISWISQQLSIGTEGIIVIVPPFFVNLLFGTLGLQKHEQISITGPEMCTNELSSKMIFWKIFLVTERIQISPILDMTIGIVFCVNNEKGSDQHVPIWLHQKYFTYNPSVAKNQHL